MKLERKHAVVLLAVAAWNILTYARFTRALIETESRPTGYYVAHSMLIVVNVVIAVVLGRWGIATWRATRAGQTR